MARERDMFSIRRRSCRQGQNRWLAALGVAVIVLAGGLAQAQDLTGSLVGVVKDRQGGAIAGAVVTIGSPVLIGGPVAQTTGVNGQLRFPALPPGSYTLDVTFSGFVSRHERGIVIGASTTIERFVVLEISAVSERVIVDGEGPGLDVRASGLEARIASGFLGSMPTRRAGMFDGMRAAPGVSPTSPSSGVATTVSVFGSGSNENVFLLDGTNTTCPCNGAARADLGVDFIQEIQIQSMGASAEFGNFQGAVFNVITRQGSDRLLHEASYYWQPAGLVAQPNLRAYPNAAGRQSGYERVRYRDASSTLGGPVVRERLWFFGGYQYVTDADSQPGTDPAFPRSSEQTKVFGKLTWRIAPRWQLVESIHNEFWSNPDAPTALLPFEATVRRHGSVPAVTLGHLTHMASPNTLWDIRVGRFAYDQESEPASGSRTTPSRFDRNTSVTTGAPVSFGGLKLSRATVKATLSHYRAGILGADHQLKGGVQIERGEHHNPSVIPTGVRFVVEGDKLFQSIASDPSTSGGLFITSSAFVNETLTTDRMTVNAGLRFDHNRAISQDLHAVDLEGRETSAMIRGLGTLYTWNVLSPRLGLAAKVTADGRTMLRVSAGRYSQGVLTGELAAFHPGLKPVTRTALAPGATSSYEDPTSNVTWDREIRAPRTDEYSIGVDRELGRLLTVTAAYVRKDGADFIGWTDIGGEYEKTTRRLADGREIPVLALTNGPGSRRYLLTNPPGYSLTYNGLVVTAERRRSQGWHASGSYTFSRVFGLQSSSGTTAAGAQSSSVAPPPAPGVTFGRDPNDLTNARGLLPNDRPHMFRLRGSVDVPRTGVVAAANLQYFSGKPWAATAQVALPNGDQRVLLEPRGSRRLSSQTLLDVRLSRTLPVGRAGRVELILDLLNVLNDPAEEGLSDQLMTESRMSSTFGNPTTFVDPRRVMFGVRVNLGR